jgi:ribosome-binding protein aMBF1 (putative translation factor)
VFGVVKTIVFTRAGPSARHQVVNDFLKRVEQAREARGLSRLELSRLCGLHPTAIQKMVERDTDPAVTVAMAMVRVLNVPLLALFYGDGWKQLEAQWRKEK